MPAAIAGAGDNAVRRFLEFFAATHKIGPLVDIEPLHVATYIEALQERMAKPTVKQHLAAIRIKAAPPPMPVRPTMAPTTKPDSG